MTEKIFAIADGLCGAGEEERELLRILASAAESRVRKASEGTDTAEDILACAAAWLAAADLLTARSAARVERITVGEVSLSPAGAESSRAEALRRQAWRLLNPAGGDGFAFLWVRG